MENLEIEYKVMINEEDYYKLKNFLLNLGFKEIIQTNYYFDTDNEAIKKANLSLRIRKIKDKYIMTLKEKKLEGRMEYEYEVKNLSLKNLPLKINEILQSKNIYVNDLKIQGELTTHRIEGNFEKGILCLDYNVYNHQSDYEIEFESNSLKYGKEVVEKLCNDLQITYKKSVLSKNGRAIRK